MSRYIRQHKRQFAGVVAPIFALFLLVAIGLSVSPGWINKSYGTPGEPCTVGDTVCDVCNGEVCAFVNSMDQCVNFPPGGPSTNTNPNIPDPTCPRIFDPGCFVLCTEQPTSTFPPEIAVCSASDAFCENISGGDSPNACRTGTCLDVGDDDDDFATGQGSVQGIFSSSRCDYERVHPSVNQGCALCTDPNAPDFNPCGDGVCEVTLGENCNTCAIDCLIPGFEDNCPLTSGTVIEDACGGMVQIPNITFGGPPYNQTGSGECEDGDLCTDNQCVGSTVLTCSVTPKACSGDLEDLCCPAGCTAPADGSSCGSDTNCDVDCGPIIECPFCGNNVIDPGEACDGTAPNNCGDLGCNDATCQCNTPNDSNDSTQGSGLLSCSLHKGRAPTISFSSMLFLGIGFAILGLGYRIRRRQN